MKNLNFLKSSFFAFLLCIPVISNAYNWSGNFLTGPNVGCKGSYGRTVSHSNTYGCNSATTTITLQYSSNNISFSSLSSLTATGNGGVYFSASNFNNSGYYRFIISGSTAPIECSNVPLTGYTSPSTYMTISVPPVVNFNINGNTAVSPTVIQTYSCVPINMNYTGSGTVDNYRLIVKEATSSGTAVPSGWNSNPSAAWTTGTVPTPNDLNSGAIGTRFVAFPGYYLVSLETDNANCSQSAVRTALIQVSGTPGVTSATFQLLKPDVGTFTVGTEATSLPGLNAGPFSISLGGFTNTSGTPTNLTGYQVVVDEVTTAGVYIATRTQTALIAAPGGALPTSLGLNSSNFSPSGYFYNQCSNSLLTSGRRFKVTLTAYNDCGSSGTYTKYFYFGSQADCFRGSSDESGVSGAIEFDAPSILVYPNPGSGEVSFEVNAVAKDLVSIVIYDLNGKQIKEVVTNATAVEGNNIYTTNIDQFNSGIYIYEVKVNDTVYNGKLSRE